MPSERDVVERLRRVGLNLGQAIAGYRDKDMKYSAEGLAECAASSSTAADLLQQLFNERDSLRLQLSACQQREREAQANFAVAKGVAIALLTRTPDLPFPTPGEKQVLELLSSTPPNAVERKPGEGWKISDETHRTIEEIEKNQRAAAANARNIVLD